MNNADIIAILKDLVTHMGLTYTDVRELEAAGNVLFSIESEDSGALIGARGETLRAINYILKKALEGRSKGAEPLRFVVDVNGYHLKHIRMLEGNARTLAERARTFKYDVEMSPMPAYDRMIVHAALQGESHLRTESVGEGEMRHIVIRYKPDENSNDPEAIRPE